MIRLASAMAFFALCAPSAVTRPLAGQTLRDVIAAAGVVPPAADDLDRPITSHAVLNDGELLAIAYYRRRPGGPVLPDSVHIHLLEKGSGSWRHSAMPRDVDAGSGGVAPYSLGSIVAVSRAGGYLYLDSHLTPSAGTVLILTRDLEPVASLPGWTRLLLPDGFVVYERSAPHFAPTYSAELWGFDPRAGQGRRIYPEPPWDSIRSRYVREVRRRYSALGERWFRENNHHMDPERFDTQLRSIASDSIGSIAFDMRFGSDVASPAATPVLEVVVLCREIRVASSRCSEGALSALRSRFPGRSDEALLRALLRSR